MLLRMMDAWVMIITIWLLGPWDPILCCHFMHYFFPCRFLSLLTTTSPRILVFISVLSKPPLLPFVRLLHSIRSQVFHSHWTLPFHVKNIGIATPSIPYRSSFFETTIPTLSFKSIVTSTSSFFFLDKLKSSLPILPALYSFLHTLHKTPNGSNQWGPTRRLRWAGERRTRKKQRSANVCRWSSVGHGPSQGRHIRLRSDSRSSRFWSSWASYCLWEEWDEWTCRGKNDPRCIIATRTVVLSLICWSECKV